KAMAQLTRTTAQRATLLNFRCPYHAKVMKRFERVRSATVENTGFCCRNCIDASAGERLLQVFPEIVDAFDADGNANQSVGDAEFRAVFRRYRRVGHHGRVLDQT